MPPAVNAPDPAATGPAPRARTVADKVMSLLGALADAGGPARLGDLAAAAGIAKASCHRMLSDLVDQGFVVSTARGEYAPGPGLRALAASLRSHDRTAELVDGALDRIARTEGHVAVHAVRVGASVRVLACANPEHLPVPVRTGSELVAEVATHELSGLLEGVPAPGFWTVLVPIDPDHEEFLGAVGFSITPPDVDHLTGTLSRQAEHLGQVRDADARAV